MGTSERFLGGTLLSLVKSAGHHPCYDFVALSDDCWNCLNAAASAVWASAKSCKPKPHSHGWENPGSKALGSSILAAPALSIELLFFSLPQLVIMNNVYSKWHRGQLGFLKDIVYRCSLYHKTT